MELPTRYARELPARTKHADWTCGTLSTRPHPPFTTSPDPARIRPLASPVPLPRFIDPRPRSVDLGYFVFVFLASVGRFDDRAPQASWCVEAARQVGDTFSSSFASLVSPLAASRRRVASAATNFCGRCRATLWLEPTPKFFTRARCRSDPVVRLPWATCMRTRLSHGGGMAKPSHQGWSERPFTLEGPSKMSESTTDDLQTT